MAATMDTLLHDYSNDCSMAAAVPYGDGRAVWQRPYGSGGGGYSSLAIAAKWPDAQ